MSDTDSDTSTKAKSHQNQKGRLLQDIQRHTRKRKAGMDGADRYRKFAKWYARTEDMFVNFFNVLDVGVRWVASDFGELTQDRFAEEFNDQLEVLKAIQNTNPYFTQDLDELMEHSENLDDLSRLMNAAAAGARSDDISSLQDRCLVYIAKDLPGGRFVPELDFHAAKDTVRGYRHVQLARMLCPVQFLTSFNTDPTDFARKLARQKVKVRPASLLCFFYPQNDIDHNDYEFQLLRNPALVRCFKHIFTSPSSALQDEPSRARVRASQAKLNGMKKVTPGSIAYTVVQFRHAILATMDWRVEEEGFDREKFYRRIIKLFALDENDENDWGLDTLTWWNDQIFGAASGSGAGDSEDEEGPNSYAILEQQRQRKKARTAKTADRSAAISGDRALPPVHVQQVSTQHHHEPNKPTLGQLLRDRQSEIPMRIQELRQASSPDHRSRSPETQYVQTQEPQYDGSQAPEYDGGNEQSLPEDGSLSPAHSIPASYFDRTQFNVLREHNRSPVSSQSRPRSPPQPSHTQHSVSHNTPSSISELAPRHELPPRHRMITSKENGRPPSSQAPTTLFSRASGDSTKPSSGPAGHPTSSESQRPNTFTLPTKRQTRSSTQASDRR